LSRQNRHLARRQIGGDDEGRRRKVEQGVAPHSAQMGQNSPAHVAHIYRAAAVILPVRLVQARGDRGQDPAVAECRRAPLALDRGQGPCDGVGVLQDLDLGVEDLGVLLPVSSAIS
jgi:hypothetical protein